MAGEFDAFINVGANFEEVKAATTSLAALVDEKMRSILATASQANSGTASFDAGRQLRELETQAQRAATNIQRYFQVPAAGITRQFEQLTKLLRQVESGSPRLDRLKFGTDTRGLSALTGLPQGSDLRKSVVDYLKTLPGYSKLTGSRIDAKQLGLGSLERSHEVSGERFGAQSAIVQSLQAEIIATLRQETTLARANLVQRELTLRAYTAMPALVAEQAAVGVRTAVIDEQISAVKAKALLAQQFLQGSEEAILSERVQVAQFELALARGNPEIIAAIATQQARLAAATAAHAQLEEEALTAAGLRTGGLVLASNVRTGALSAIPNAPQTAQAAASERQIALKRSQDAARAATAESAAAAERRRSADLQYRAQTRQAEIDRSREAQRQARAAADARRAALAQAGPPQPVRPPTVFQRLYGSAKGIDPAGAPTAGRLLGGRLATTASYLASTAILFGSIAAIRKMVTQSEELEAQLNILESQFRALDETDRLDKVKKDIFEIARNTGLATDEVARLAVQFTGAFGPELGTTAEKIAAQIAVVGDLEPSEIFNDLVAGAKAFADIKPGADQATQYQAQIDALQELSDVSTAVRNVTGVQQKELLDFLGRVGPVAKNAGLDLNEAAAAGAALLQGSSLGGGALGEQFNRILTTFSEQKIEIAKLVGGSPALQGAIDRSGNLKGFQEGLNKGDASILFDLARGFNELGEAQRRQLIAQVGSRREGQTLAVFLQNATTALQAQEEAEDSAGTTAREFARKQETLQQTLKRLRAEFEQFGLQIFNAGLGDALKDLALIAGIGVKGLSLVLDVLTKLNDITGGWAAQLAAAYVAVRLLGGALAVGSFVRGALAGGGGAASAVGAREAAVAAGYVPAAAGAAGGLAARVGGAFTTNSVLAGGGVFGETGFAATAAANPLIAGVAGLAVLSKYVDTKSGVQSVAKDFATNLKDATQEEVDRIAQTRTTGFASFGNFIFGNDQPDELARQEQRRRAAERQDLPTKLEAAGRLNISAPHATEIASGILASIKEKPILSQGKKVNIGGEVVSGLTGDLGAVVSELQHNNDAKAVELLKGLVEDGAEGASDFARLYLVALQGLPEAGAKFSKAFADLTKEKSAETTIKDLKEGTTAADLDVLKQSFESGTITAGQYISALTTQRDAIQIAIKGQPATQEFLDAIAGLNNEINDVISAGIAAAGDYEVDLLGLSGSDPTAVLAARRRQLKDPRLTNPKDRAKVAHEIVAAQQQVLQQMASAAESVEEQQKILREGLAIDPEVRTEFYAEFIRADVIWQQFLEGQYGTLLGAADFIDQIVKLAIDQGITIAQAAQKLIDQKTADANAELDRLKTANLRPGQRNAEIEEQKNYVGNIPKDDETKNLPDVKVPDKVTDVPGAEGLNKSAGPTADEIKAEAKALALARISVREAQANGDPVALAKLAKERAQVNLQFAEHESERVEAQAELIKANQALNEAYRDIAIANRDLRVALSHDDPVKAAQAAVADAYLAYLAAQGQTAKAKAMAELVRAQRSEQDAIFDLAEARTDILIAEANATGDTVKAAQYALDKIKHQLARKDLNRTERAQLRAQQVSAEAAVRDARLSEERATIDYQLAIGQITKQQAIGALQALLTIPKLTEEQIREINLTIKGLRDQLGADFQFNLPTQLGLPTVYEVRRLGQSGGAGAGYNDNRQITVTVYAETNASPDEIAAQVANVVGQPNRSGTLPRRF